MINVTDDSFEKEVVDFNNLVFIDFWAAWCGPCKVMMPKYADAAEKFGSEKVKFVKYEAGAPGCNEKSQEYNIRGLPTFLAVYRGDVVDTMIGAGDIQEFVRRNIENI